MSEPDWRTLFIRAMDFLDERTWEYDCLDERNYCLECKGGYDKAAGCLKHADDCPLWQLIGERNTLLRG